MEIKTSIPIYNPTIEPKPEPAQRVPRDDTLSGKRIGLLWNSKVNGDKLMRYVLEELRANGVNVSIAVELKKENYTRPALPETYDVLSEECDVVLAAIGD